MSKISYCKKCGKVEDKFVGDRASKHDYVPVYLPFLSVKPKKCPGSLKPTVERS